VLERKVAPDPLLEPLDTAQYRQVSKAWRAPADGTVRSVTAGPGREVTPWVAQSRNASSVSESGSSANRRTLRRLFSSSIRGAAPSLPKSSGPGSATMRAPAGYGFWAGGGGGPALAGRGEVELQTH